MSGRGKGIGNVPNRLQLLLALLLLPTTDEEMSVFCLAPLDLHKLVKLHDPPLTATPPLAALVEDGRARVMHTALSFPIASFVHSAASFPPARHALLDLQTRVVVFRLWRRCGRSRWLGRSLCGR